MISLAFVFLINCSGFFIDELSCIGLDDEFVSDCLWDGADCINIDDDGAPLRCDDFIDIDEDGFCDATSPDFPIANDCSANVIDMDGDDFIDCYLESSDDCDSCIGIDNDNSDDCSDCINQNTLDNEIYEDCYSKICYNNSDVNEDGYCDHYTWNSNETIDNSMSVSFYSESLFTNILKI